MANTEFVIDSDKKQKIADAFKVELKDVDSIGSAYADLNNLMHSQYLAHITRAMEMTLRKKLNYDLFIIKCEPFKVHVKNQSHSSAQYFQGQRFVIYYDGTLDPKNRRNCIAHELGHLFLIALLDAANKDKRRPMYEGTTEPLSSIFGVFAISDKTNFYANVHTSDINHKDWNSIMDDFVNIYNSQNLG